MKIKLLVTGITILCVAVLSAGCVQIGSVPDAPNTTTSAADQTPITPTAPPTPTALQPTAAAPLDSPTAPPTTPPEEAASPPIPTQEPTAPTARAAKDCADTAAFFGDVTIPDGTAFKQNQPLVKTWRVRNEGTCTWGPAYSLIFYGGDQMNGLPPVQSTAICRARSGG